MASPAPSPVILQTYADALDAYRRKELAQAQYDEADAVLADVLVNLHGTRHRDRRRVENRLFRRETFDHYEKHLFPVVVDEVLAPCLAAGRAELVRLGHDLMLHLATVVAGIDRPAGTAAETARLQGYLSLFIEALTLAQSTLDKPQRRAAIATAMTEWTSEFLTPSQVRRETLLSEFAAGAITEDELPKDVLTTLLRHRGELGIDDGVIARETAFFLLVAAHTSATAFLRVTHHVLDWLAAHPEDTARVRTDRFFVQRCVHETIRLNPSSTVGMRRALASVTLRSGIAIPEQAKVIIDLRAVNRDVTVYGPDAAEFNPHRRVPAGIPPYGLSFAAGMHVCIGQDLAAGVVNQSGTAHPDEHLFGLVALGVHRLFQVDLCHDPADLPRRDPTTERVYWASYPLLLGAHRVSPTAEVAR